jgi:RimJ/RimL family protein N-acetyltransferase
MNTSLVALLKTAFDDRHVNALSFRPVARCDAFPLFEASRHPEFNRFLLWPAPQKEQGTVLQVDKLIREWLLNMTATFSIVERMSGTWVGLVKLFPYKDPKGVLQDGVEMSLMIHSNAWATGVVERAGRGVVQTLLDVLPGLPIYIRFRVGNTKMEKVCRHYKFEYLGPTTEKHLIEGDIDLKLFRVDPVAWEAYAGLVHY